MINKTAAVLWTGGKDCALAFFKAQQAGYNITHLVTFAPKNPDFKAHPIHLIKKQVKAIGIPHLILTVIAPIKESYQNTIQQLKEFYKIDTLITGDIDEIDGHTNWIEECSLKSGMKVFNPLWKKERIYLLNELITNDFTVVFSLVKKEDLTSDWIGRTLDKTAINDLKKKLNIDICGENGEYHTMVLNAPFFKHQIVVNKVEVIENDKYYYLKTIL